MQTIYTDKIQLVDKKYFHKTQYAIIFKMKFDTDLLHNKIQFNTTYWTYKTIDEFNNLLSYYQISKDKTDKAIKILQNCKTHINSTIEKCYDKYCIEIYEYLMNCYDEILELKELNKKPNWNYFVKSIKPHIENIHKFDIFHLETNYKLKEIKENNIKYKIINTQFPDDDYFQVIRNIFFKKYSYNLKGKEFVFFYDLLFLICNIYNCLYTYNDNIENITNKKSNIFKYKKINNSLDNYFNNLDEKYIMKIIPETEKETIINILTAFFDEYREPLFNNLEIKDSYYLLKLIFEYIKEDNFSISKLITKELIRKHKYFLIEVEL